MEYVVAILSALSDPVRLRALALLSRKGELCVCELTQALQVSQPTVSKQMGTLREAGLVKVRRDAQWVLYSLSDDLTDWAAKTVAAVLEGLRATQGHEDDVGRLGDMRRPDRRRSA
jgi:ArsR family transcriptional regulator